jgi:NAD(P)H dehydrogenase (quinone)
VEHVVYTPIIRKGGSGFVLPEATEPDIFTEQMLRVSGLDHTILAHPPFLESLPFLIGDRALESGVRVPSGSGKAAPASRDDLAEAQAVVLTGTGHENKTYALHGEPAISFADVAQVLSTTHGTDVAYVPVSDEEYLADLTAAGLPQPAAEFALAWVRGVNAGEWDEPAGDLEDLIGRKPMNATDFFRDNYPAGSSDS